MVQMYVTPSDGPLPLIPRYRRYINPLGMCVPRFNFVTLTVLEKKSVTKIYLLQMDGTFDGWKGYLDIYVYLKKKNLHI